MKYFNYKNSVFNLKYLIFNQPAKGCFLFTNWYKSPLYCSMRQLINLNNTLKYNIMY